MATPTHLISTGLGDLYLGPHETADDFEVELRGLDGHSNCSIILCKLPRPGWSGDFASPELLAAKNFYIQAVGRADKITLEIRRTEKGQVAQFVVGLISECDQSRHPNIVIGIGNSATTVYESEVFNARSAAQVLYEYYLNEDIPQSYALRRIEV